MRVIEYADARPRSLDAALAARAHLPGFAELRSHLESKGYRVNVAPTLTRVTAPRAAAKGLDDRARRLRLAESGV